MIPKRKSSDWIELPPNSTIVAVAEEVLTAKWDGRLGVADCANPDLVAKAALMILDCASGEVNNNNRMPFIVPEECWYIGGIIMELVRTADEIDDLLPEGSPEDRSSLVIPKLGQHGYVITAEVK